MIADIIAIMLIVGIVVIVYWWANAEIYQRSMEYKARLFNAHMDGTEPYDPQRRHQ